MKKICKWMLIAAVLVFPIGTKAQDIQVKRFEVNPTNLMARRTPVLDNSGEACAVIHCYVRGDGFTIEPFLGVLKTEVLDGEIRLWVPQGTKKITVRHKDSKPLIGYTIPVRIEAKTDYDMDIEIAPQGTNTANKGHNVYIGAGYQIMSVSGPSLAVGANFKHHIVELGAVYGLNKTDDLYFYNSGGNVKAGYNYSAFMAQLRYGYEIPISDFFSLTPQVGMSYNAYRGKEIANGGNSDNYKNASSLSAIGAVRLTVSISNSFKLCLTPEFDAAVYKDESCKLISSYDSTMKNWHTGFNLNVGLMFYF